MHTKQITTYILAIMLGLTSSSYSYEVVKAVTIKNDKEPQGVHLNSKKIIPPTFNDPELPNFTDEDTVSRRIQKKLEETAQKFKKNKSDITPQDEVDSENESDIEENVDEISEVNKESTLRPVKKVQDEVVKDKNKFQINADSMTYDESDGNVYAKGHVEIISNDPGIILKSDEALLEKQTQTLKLYGNVKILKDGIEMLGEYMLVDLNEENILMDNPVIEAYSFKINAQEAHLIANDIQAVNGTVKSASDSEYTLQTRGFMVLNRTNEDFLEARKSLIKEDAQDDKRQSYKINAKEIVFTSYKDHNSVLLKDSDIYFNNHKIFRGQDIEIISDKENTINDLSAPEIGSVRAFGTYFGYGFIQKLPKGQILKLMPAITYGDNNIGVGIIARHRSKNSYIQAGWNTSTSNIVGSGLYKFGNGLKLRYGRNAYLPEGFLGARRSGYGAQFEYQKSYRNRDLNLSFNHGFYGGFFTEYKKHKQEDAYATTRFRYMAQINKQILKYKNEEQDLDIILSAMAQSAVSVYGSGYTFGIARIGPMITSRVKRWESSIAYMLSGVHGDSPFRFDKYRYGKSTIMLNERINLNDKISFGYRAFVTPMKDNIEDKLLTESRFYAIFGPKDLKLAISYDFVREAGYIDLMLLLGGNSSKINFEKMTTQNVDGGNQKRDFYRSNKRIKVQEPQDMI